MLNGFSHKSISEEPSRRNSKIPPFIVMEIMERAQQMEAAGEKIVHMEVGEPEGETPAEIKEAALEALRRGDTHYTHSLGKYDLREEIARYYHQHYGVSISPGQVVVTSGSSPAMLLVFSALLDPGDEVILSDPYYACYPNFISYALGKPVLAPVEESEGFKLRAEQITRQISSRTRAILINSPANPTGAVLSGDELAEIAALGPIVISDEIYHGLNYQGRDHSILEYTDRAIVINGFSKRHLMTGWRLGFAIAPLPLVRVMQKLQQNLFISACAFVQAAGIAALRESGARLASRLASYNRRRLMLFEGLQQIGIAPAEAPMGAFYMLANVTRFTRESYPLALEILQQEKVAVTPGIDFGPHAEGYLRLSYACSKEEIEEGLRRLQNFFNHRRP